MRFSNWPKHKSTKFILQKFKITVAVLFDLYLVTLKTHLSEILFCVAAKVEKSALIQYLH